MSIGGLLALLVLIAVAIALIFSVAMPAWLPLALTGALALAVLLSAYPLKWGAP